MIAGIFDEHSRSAKNFGNFGNSGDYGNGYYPLTVGTTCGMILPESR
jgi:hypothetical protein